MKRAIEDFFPNEFGLLDRDKTIFVFPIGGFEGRGPHLNLGYSLKASQILANRFAEAIDQEFKGERTTVVFTPAPMIVDSQNQAIRVVVRPYVLRDWLVDTCLSLHKLGFKNFLALSSNLTPKQLTAIEEAEKLIRRKTGSTVLSEILKKNPGQSRFLSITSSWIPKDEQMSSLFFPNAADSGGERDTSWAMALDSSLVKNEAIPRLALTRESSLLEALKKRLKNESSDYVGSPSLASSETGKHQIDASILQSARHAADFLRGIPQGSRFRTWYSVVPTNKSFFKAWLLSLLIFVLFCFFVAMSF